jgi:CRP-like cAMP-binding protein
MALADLILLCSGQFTVRQIVEKIYRKQGAVPFKWVLSALHSLHQGGFFENSEELHLNSNLESWVSPKKSRWHISWRFGQRILADQASPSSYYVLTLGLLVFALLGLQYFPGSPSKLVQSWAQEKELFFSFWSIFVMTSAVQSLRFLFYGIQLLLLTGKAYNVSFRLSPWGLHLHVGDESNMLFEDRLYTSMLHISQILFPWVLVYWGSFFLDTFNIKNLLIVSLAMTGWGLNPFVSSEGRKLIKSLLIPSDRDMITWHFDQSTLINTLSPDLQAQDREFARICSVWGSIWLILATALLQESAIFFGPDVLEHIVARDSQAWSRGIALIGWVVAVYLTLHTLIEKIVAPPIEKIWDRIKARFSGITSDARKNWPNPKIRNHLEGLPLFSHFHEQYLDAILDQSELLTLNPGTLLIRQGDPSTDLFVLLQGRMIITHVHAGREDWISELNAVSVFGEASLVDSSPRGAFVRSASVCVVLKCGIRTIRKIAQDAGTIRHIEDFRNAILVNQFFASSPVFRSLSSESIEFLQNRGSLEYFNLGQTIFHQGDQGDSIYLILRGSVEVFIHERRVKTLKQGSFFGEIALIANIPRTGTVLTKEPCVLFKLSSDSFWEILVQYMDLGVFIETISESRLKEDLELADLDKKSGTGSN